MPSKKLISFCIVGRNDDYLGNFRYRISTAINYLAWSAKKVDILDLIEIIITDWNSEIPLCNALDLSPEAAAITSFISVPPKIANKYHNQYDGQEFNTTCAINIALRRAFGTYLTMMPADCFFSSTSLQNFIKILNHEFEFPYDVAKCLFKISRRMIPYQFWKTEPAIEELEAYLINLSGKLPYCPATVPDITSGLGAIMAHRDLWHLACGFDESNGGYGFSDTEFGLRIEQVYPSQELSHYGVWCYDLDGEILANRKQGLNSEIYNNQIAINSEDWGLGNELLEIQKYKSPSYAIGNKKELICKCKFNNREELINHMAREKYYFFLKNHLPFSKVFRVNYKIFYPLIWYGLTFRLDKYLEFGISDKSGAPVATLANSCTNIFIVFQSQKEYADKLLSPLDIFTFLNAVNYTDGRCRFIGGNLDSALERIEKSSNGKVLFDLVLFQPELHKGNTNSLLEKIMDHLSTNGAIVISADSNELFRSCWEESRKRYPSCTFVQCFKDEVGIVLKSKMESECDVVNEDQEMEILKKIWRPVKKKMIVYFFVYGLNLLEEFFKKCFYEPFWRWPVIVFNHCRLWRNNR